MELAFNVFLLLVYCEMNYLELSEGEVVQDSLSYFKELPLLFSSYRLQKYCFLKFLGSVPFPVFTRTFSLLFSIIPGLLKFNATSNSVSSMWASRALS